MADIVSVNSELPVFVGGDHRFIMGRGDIIRNSDNTFEVNMTLTSEAGRRLVEMLADRIPVGLNIVQSPARQKES